MPHVPVLLKEVLELLDLRAGGICIDATFGGGGHSFSFLEKIGPQGRVLAIDADLSVIERSTIQAPESRLKNLSLVHGNFRELKTIAESRGLKKVDVILFDLGLSSLELDDPSRGFSFQKDGPLDMRFDRTTGRPAAQLLAETSERDLAEIFKEYGEERFAKRIARGVVAARAEKRLDSTSELFEVIKRSLPGALRYKAGDFARRIFQALRIAVNGELESLELALPQALDLLKPGGRLAVISFHSLEDRIVKQFFVQKSRGCVCPPEFPECICGKKPLVRILTKKPLVPSEQELIGNTRARSAKLRAVLKTEG